MKRRIELGIEMSFYGQVVDASGPGGDEGRGVAAISPGEVPSNL